MRDDDSESLEIGIFRFQPGSRRSDTIVEVFPDRLDLGMRVHSRLADVQQKLKENTACRREQRVVCQRPQFRVVAGFVEIVHQPIAPNAEAVRHGRECKSGTFQDPEQLGQFCGSGSPDVQATTGTVVEVFTTGTLTRMSVRVRLCA